MNRIYFVRHGEGQDNVARKFSSTWTDHSLTERGRLQALQTGQSLAGRHIDGVFCSPMKRTHETAQIIAEQLDVEPVVLKELREVNVGVLEGKDFSDETWGVYHGLTSQWYAGNPHAAFPGGENYAALWERMKRGMLKVLQDHESRRFVIAGHGGIFIATLKEYCPGLETGWLQNAEYYNCAITELEVEVLDGELRGRIVEWANHRHLSADALSTAPAIPPLASIKRA